MLQHGVFRTPPLFSIARCPHCEYETADGPSFRRHMWRHTDEKPYKCDRCQFGCIQKGQMISHYKNKHHMDQKTAHEHAK